MKVADVRFGPKADKPHGDEGVLERQLHGRRGYAREARRRGLNIVLPLRHGLLIGHAFNHKGGEI